MDLQTVIKRQREAQKALEKAAGEYEKTKAKFELEIAECKRMRENVINGLDLDKITLAETLIEVRGEYKAPQRIGAIEDAITDIAEGAPKLRREYFGVKRYAHFGDQRSDHRYGYGPSHGSIVFRIGFTQHALNTISEGHELEPLEIEACLYYLEALKQGKLVREAVSR